ncbi:hypothetical protein EV192_111170 [Actinocrispum wychmicini]|uniref:Uncharacterized protein n=1 Tax=Actinocrispum wychmicini TaxID=1213861 RepID=A0A4R2J8Q1_9PSEU|nr:hypothetical protein EV192_111170 [Actinocrispum wychmicini]
MTPRQPPPTSDTRPAHRTPRGGDYPLPPLQPDWEDPEPTDAPGPEETHALAALVSARDAVTNWLTLATGVSLAPVAYREIVRVLLHTIRKCVAADTDSSVGVVEEGRVATHIFGEVILHPHPSVSIDGICGRCHLPEVDPVHAQIVEVEA